MLPPILKLHGSLTELCFCRKLKWWQGKGLSIWSWGAYKQQQGCKGQWLSWVRKAWLGVRVCNGGIYEVLHFLWLIKPMSAQPNFSVSPSKVRQMSLTPLAKTTWHMPPAHCPVLLHVIAPLHKRDASLLYFQLTWHPSPDSPIPTMSAQGCFPAPPLQFVKSWLSLPLMQHFAIGAAAVCGRRGVKGLFFLSIFSAKGLYMACWNYTISKRWKASRWCLYYLDLDFAPPAIIAAYWGGGRKQRKSSQSKLSHEGGNRAGLRKLSSHLSAQLLVKPFWKA